MRFTRLTQTALLALTSAWFAGCVPSAPSQLDEEKEPHFLAGKSRQQQMDYRGAIESFEKALEVNPQSASAHFELGYLYAQKDPDPAAAIYHFERFCKLRPRDEKLELVKQQVTACKQELARTVMLGPLTEKAQRDLEQMAEENKRLRDELERWRAYGRSQTNLEATLSRTTRTPVSQPTISSTPDAAAGLQSSQAQPGTTRTPSPATATATRTHTVKQGETLATIARKYGVKLEALTSANPRTDPRRLRIGQTLTIPGS